MIKGIGIKKTFGQIEVLKNIDIEVSKGEIVSIVGTSGAGKTTLLQILGTLLPSDAGKIIINGTDISKLKGNKLAQFRNKNIGFVFQFHHLLPEFSALENICIPAYIAKESKLNAEKRAMELLEVLNLSHRANHKPNELSGGEKQRVAIARSLINNPSIVFADEPSGNLDSENSEELYKLIFMLRKEYNQTFIIVSHNKELSKLTDRTLLINDGKIT